MRPRRAEAANERKRKSQMQLQANERRRSKMEQQKQKQKQTRRRAKRLTSAQGLELALELRLRSRLCCLLLLILFSASFHSVPSVSSSSTSNKQVTSSINSNKATANESGDHTKGKFNSESQFARCLLESADVKVGQQRGEREITTIQFSIWMALNLKASDWDSSRSVVLLFVVENLTSFPVGLSLSSSLAFALSVINEEWQQKKSDEDFALLLLLLLDAKGKFVLEVDEK